MKALSLTLNMPESDRIWLAGVLDIKMRFEGKYYIWIQGDPEALTEVLEVVGLGDRRKDDEGNYLPGIDRRKVRFTYAHFVARVLAIALPYMRVQKEEATALLERVQRNSMAGPIDFEFVHLHNEGTL